MEDLQAVRTAKRAAAEREQAARSERERLEAEEGVLLSVIAYRRTLDGEANPEADEPPIGPLLSAGKVFYRGKEYYAPRYFGDGGDDVTIVSGTIGNRSEPEPEEDAKPRVAVTKEQPPRKRVPLRVRILALMHDRPEHEAWSPVELYDELVRVGVQEIEKSAVRVALRRMLKSEEVVRVEEGRYRLPEGAGQMKIQATGEAADAAPEAPTNMGAAE